MEIMALKVLITFVSTKGFEGPGIHGNLPNYNCISLHF